MEIDTLHMFSYWKQKNQNWSKKKSNQVFSLLELNFEFYTENDIKQIELSDFWFPLQNRGYKH